MGVGCIRFWVYVSLAAFASLMSTISGVQEHGWLTHFSPYLALIGVLVNIAFTPYRILVLFSNSPPNKHNSSVLFCEIFDP